MDTQLLEKNIWKDFNNAIALICVIPLLAFLYLMSMDLEPFQDLMIDSKEVMVTVVIIILLGLIVGRQLMRKIVKELIAYNRRVVRMQEEMVEKNRIAAISQTVLALSHAINDPLMLIMGYIQILKKSVEKSQRPEEKEALKVIEDNCERIKQVLAKMSNISKPVVERISSSEICDIKAIDLEKSV